jgi:diaminohydroxyphosphoribosylaminopyrimidine deaminase/5-amino-6-(5-phosphoribosylamino)uracil reductase
MRRALELARLGFGNVSPNPMVGCVIVHNGLIIGEGFHREYGGPHAEVHAVNAVENKALLSESDVYVTLEPCSHFGKTPPCADLLVEHKVNKVTISNNDPNPMVAGQGIKKLENAGIVVVEGILKEEGYDLNKRYFTSAEQNRPYVILKWAETADRFIARKDFDSKWISNEFSRKLVHKWRAQEDAVLVGKNTAKYDNPTLNVRDWEGNDPLRIVIDHELSLDHKLNLFNPKIPTVCYNLKKHEELKNLSFVKLKKADFIQKILTDLHQRNIQSLIIEGGALTITEFIQAGLWDEARIFQAETCFGDGIRAPQLSNAEFEGKENIMGDTLTYFKRAKH